MKLARNVMIGGVSRALDVHFGKILQNQERDRQVGEQMCRDAPERSRGIASVSVRREHDEIYRLFARDVEQRLPLVGAAENDRPHGQPIAPELITKVLEVSRCARLEARRQLARSVWRRSTFGEKMVACVVRKGASSP